MPQPIRIFISYAREDLEHLQALEKHLANLKLQGVIEVWTDQKLLASTEWSPELLGKLRGAHIVLVLISPDMMASEFIHDIELKDTLERHRRGEVRVVPILVRPTDLKGHALDRLQGLPRNFTPVTEWPNRDAAWLDVVKELRKLLDDIAKASRTPAPTPASTPAPTPGKWSNDDKGWTEVLVRLREPLQALELERRQRLGTWLRWLLPLLLPVLLLGLLRLTVIREHTLHPTLPLATLPVLLVTPASELNLQQFRDQVARVIVEAGKRGVRAVFLDMDFSRENGLEAETELRTALAHVHALPVPMAVIAMQSTERQKTPLIQTCYEHAQDCFDALVDPRFLERVEGLESPWPVVNACPDHQPGLAWTLAALLSSPGWSDKPRPTLEQTLQEGCVSTWFRLRSAETETETVTGALEAQASIAATDYLSLDPTMTPAASVLLIAELDGDHDGHDVMLMDPAPVQNRLLGPHLQLLMARHLLAAAQTRGATESAWSWKYRYIVRGGI